MIEIVSDEPHNQYARLIRIKAIGEIASMEALERALEKSFKSNPRGVFPFWGFSFIYQQEEAFPIQAGKEFQMWRHWNSSCGSEE